MYVEEFNTISSSIAAGQTISVRYNGEEKSVKQCDVETQSVLLDINGKDIFINIKTLELIKRGLPIGEDGFAALKDKVGNGTETFVLYNNERKKIEELDAETQSFLIDINGTKIFVPYQKLALAD